MAEKKVVDDGKNQHGFPRGYHFVPKDLELIRFLKDKLDGRPLPNPLPSIFHDVRIRDFHPAYLHDVYERHEEDGFIYFFDRREFPTRRAGRPKPVRATRDGVWKASGGGKALTTMKHGGVVVGYKLTLVFYQKKFAGDKDPDKTEWGLNEYTRIIGPDKKVADLALYRLYKLKNGKGKKDTGQGIAASSIKGKEKMEELPSPGPKSMASVASTSQAPAEASAGDNMLSQVRRPHCYHDSAFGAPSSAPGPSSWVTPAAATNPTTQRHNGVHAGFMGLLTGSPAPATYPSTSPQQKVVDNHSELADWDNMPPMALVADDLPSQQQAAEHSGYSETAEPNDEQPLKMLEPPPLAAPAAQSYLDDEFMVWCQAEQQQQQQQDPEAGCPWFPMTDDDFMLTDLPTLTDEDDELCKFTYEELMLMAGMSDEASPDDVDAGKADTDKQV